MSVTDRELIDRYLAGTLDEVAREAVEVRIIAESAFRREVELTEALREGLHELDSTGRLANVNLDTRRFWERPAYALAASVAAGLLGITAFAIYGQLERTRGAMVTLQQELIGSRPATASRVTVLTLVRTRSSGPDLRWKASAQAELLEFRLDPGPAPVAAYRVSLVRIEDAQRIEIVNAPAVAPSSTGEVVFGVNSRLLAPGDYEVVLAPVGADEAATRYRVKVEH